MPIDGLSAAVGTSAKGDRISSPGGRPGVFILSDVRLYREGLALCLSRQPKLAMLGMGDHSAAALARAIDHKPDVIVLDVADPRSFDVAKALRVHLPRVKLVAFAIGDGEQEVLACAAAGFAGYVARDGSEDDLLAAIENAYRGELSCSPRMASMLFNQVAVLSVSHRPADEPHLTRRERQILEYLARGLSNKEIAREMRIGNATVKNHVHSVLEKLHVRRRGEAAARLHALRQAEEYAHGAARRTAGPP
jgi:two-component system, NarL family, nitrate/nitrite response regulator NarL